MRQYPAPADAFIIGVAIARIVGRHQPGRIDDGAQGQRVDIEQRPIELAVLGIAEPIHAAQALDAAAMREPHQHGFGLIAEMVSGEEDIDAISRHRRCHQPVAGSTGGGLDTSRRLGAIPAQGARREAQLFGLGNDRVDLRGGFRPEPVIDGIDKDRRHIRVPLFPVGNQQHEGKTVRAAGNGEPDAAPLKQRRKPGFGVDAHDTGHFAFWFSSASRCRKAGDRSG